MVLPRWATRSLSRITTDVTIVGAPSHWFLFLSYCPRLRLYSRLYLCFMLRHEALCPDGELTPSATKTNNQMRQPRQNPPAPLQLFITVQLEDGSTE